ncbi:hypothetical protein LH51_16515 [Nitrincola sp. A-D6]|uniref:DNA-directed RNA polymerase n=1 Tax=Nitrincola sp. A-D6 TaxID=1545442 RepID=UPI00051FDA61|nr:DNA-directed RNA polymerase [Nitrincola sp. A-D6]KGK41206.1 hypothetical protein LH51_16515 [Nitrincola sp. A-D6]
MTDNKSLRILEIDESLTALYTTQAELEEEMTQAGVERYERNLTKAIGRGGESDTTYAQRLIDTKAEILAEEIKAWREQAELKAGRRHVALKYLKDIDAREAAFITLKSVLNSLSKGRPTTSIAIEIGGMIEDQIRLKEVRAKDKYTFKNIDKAQRRKSEYSRKRNVSVFIQDAHGIEWDYWCQKTKLLVGSVLITCMLDAVGIVEEVKHGAKAKGIKDGVKTVSYLQATPDTLKWIKEANAYNAVMRPIYEPMIIEPLDWLSPVSGGYLTSLVRPLRLVKTSNRNYLEELANHDMPLVYKALNAIQKTAWKVNKEQLELLNSLAHTDSELGGLPRATDYTLPEKPADIDDNEVSRLEWRIGAARVYEANLKLTAKRQRLFSILKTAERYADFPSIYMPWTLDFRGRVYCVPALSPQGEDYVKSLLQFANGEALGTEEAADWLAVHIANLFGVDKVSFEDRIQWTKDNTEMLVAIAENPYDNRQWSDADKPFQAVVAAREWAGYMQNGLKHVTRIPIALDGSCSGLQNFGMALRCEVTGKSVNLLPSDKPSDIYQEVMDKAEASLRKRLDDRFDELTDTTAKELAVAKVKAIYFEHNPEGKPDGLAKFLNECVDFKPTEAKEKPSDMVKEGRKAFEWTMASYHWLKFGVSRKTAKRSVMTFPYGSKEFGFREQLMEDILSPAKRDLLGDIQRGLVSEEKFAEMFPFKGDGFMASGLMAKELWDAVRSTVLKAGEAMEWLQVAAKMVAAEGLPVRWTTPLGFPVQQDYKETKHQRVETTLAGKRTVLSIHRAEDKVNVRKSASSVAPNFVHSMDSSHLLLVTARFAERLREKGLDVSLALIHDSFGTLASRTGGKDGLFTIIREAFVELYSEHDVMENFRDEMLEQLSLEAREELPPTPEKGNLDLEIVLQSRYCFA